MTKTAKTTKISKEQLKKQLSKLGVSVVKGNYIKRSDLQLVVAEYNGYTNYETWNVQLWISNEEGSYKDAKRHKPFNADSAEEYVKSVYPKGTPDFKDMGGARCYDKVNWKEIAEAFNEY